MDLLDRSRGAPIRAEINVTPLIDVMLVLLILFMVVSPVATPILDAHLPDTSSGGKR